MSQRYSTRVVTRVAGAVADPDDANAVEDRIIQLSADIGGPPDTDITNADAPASVVEAINEMLLPRSFPATLLVPSGTGLEKVVHAGGAVSWNETAPASKTINGAISLAHGCKVTTLTAYGNLTDVDASVVVKLQRVALATGGVTTLATVTMTGSTGDLSGSDALNGGTPEVIDNSQYAYQINVQMVNDTGANEAIYRGAKLV
jgi:hypothetical protein